MESIQGKQGPKYPPSANVHLKTRGMEIHNTHPYQKGNNRLKNTLLCSFEPTQNADILTAAQG